MEAGEKGQAFVQLVRYTLHSVLLCTEKSILQRTNEVKVEENNSSEVCLKMADLQTKRTEKSHRIGRICTPIFKVVWFL